MTRDEIEMVPEQVISGKISWEQATRELILFVLRNKPLFGLIKYDEDFISELTIEFLSKATDSLRTYVKQNGSFFTYIYCIVRNICCSISKRKTAKKFIEYHNIHECIATYENKIDAYNNIHYDDFEKPKIPYRYKPISYEDFQIACKTNSYHITRVINSDKSNIASEIKKKLVDFSPHMIQNIIMVVALKASFYITEEQIEGISNMFNIDKDKFHQIVQELKILMEERIRNKTIIEIRRNKAYFQHKKLRDQIEWNEFNNETSEYTNLKLKKQYNKNTKSWNNLNHQLEEGKIMIRPTTKLIAQVMGISTRQVTYYQSTARKLGIDISKV